ncbi:DUF6776 family protein [Ferrimonas pelagia]|uniref:MSHA biogenesis protein MshJ n=1 Tax=Ferrimonas pelagia TaxID=1177826 RepID=A0ABP9FE98_9GAMM
MMQYIKHRIHALQQLEQRLNPRGVILLLLLLAAMGLGAGVQWLRQLPQSQQLLQYAQAQVEEQAALRDCERERSALALELRMEQQSQQETLALMARQRVQMDELERELTFYRNIMAPEKTADGVFIHDLSLDETGNAQRFRMRLVLTQQKLQKRFARGEISWSIDGSLDGHSKSLTAEELGADSNSTNFSFRYFQQIDTLIALPEGFYPERLRVQIRLPANSEQKAARAETTYGFTELVSAPVLARLKEKA